MFKGWITPSTGQIATQWTRTGSYWIVICPEGSVRTGQIQPLYNPAHDFNPTLRSRDNMVDLSVKSDVEACCYFEEI